MSGKSPLTATAEQRAGLERQAASRNREEADRARAILLSLSGWTSITIGEALRGTGRHGARLALCLHAPGACASGAGCGAGEGASRLAGGAGGAGRPGGQPKQLDFAAAGRRDREAHLPADFALAVVRGAAQNVWPAQVASDKLDDGLNSLHKRIRHVGAMAATKMEIRASRSS